MEFSYPAPSTKFQFRMPDYQKQLIRDFTALGVAAGDVLLVHSSLNAVGRFPDRARLLVEALQAVLGPKGTLLMPALSYASVTRETPFFSLARTPSCVGGLTEYFRQRADTRRSVHPTHSVCAVGPETERLLGDHHLDTTPCGPHSPFRKLREAGGKLLFLGCGLRVNTSMHAIEELSPPPYLFGPPLQYLMEVDDQTYRKTYIPHDFAGVEQRYERALKLLDADDYSFGKVLLADSYLLRTEPLWEKAHAKLLEAPFFFVDQSARP